MPFRMDSFVTRSCTMLVVIPATSLFCSVSCNSVASPIHDLQRRNFQLYLWSSMSSFRAYYSKLDVSMHLAQIVEARDKKRSNNMKIETIAWNVVFVHHFFFCMNSYFCFPYFFFTEIISSKSVFVRLTPL